MGNIDLIRVDEKRSYEILVPDVNLIGLRDNLEDLISYIDHHIQIGVMDDNCFSTKWEYQAHDPDIKYMGEVC